MPGNEDTPGLVIGATLARDPPGDALVLRPGVSLDDFRRSRGKGFKIGTNAVRRAAYARRLFPEVEVIHYRGAADTRVRKLDHPEMQRLPDGGAVGPADALIMARSGLERVGLASRIAYEFPIAGNAAGGGAGHRRGGMRRRRLADAAACCRGSTILPRIAARDAEREVLWVLNGHCNSPIAGFSTIDGRADVADRLGAGSKPAASSSRPRAPAPPTARANSAARSGSNCWPRARPRSSSAAGPSRWLRRERRGEHGALSPPCGGKVERGVPRTRGVCTLPHGGGNRELTRPSCASLILTPYTPAPAAASARHARSGFPAGCHGRG